MFIKNVWLWTLLSMWGSCRSNESVFQRAHWLVDQLLAGLKVSLLWSRLATQHRLPWWSTPVTSVPAWWWMMMMVVMMMTMKPKERRITHLLASCYSHDFIFLLSLINSHFSVKLGVVFVNTQVIWLILTHTHFTVTSARPAIMSQTI